MQRRVGHVRIETIVAESPKFTASMVFVHGLWCTAAVWRKFMGFFAHRGWTSYAVNLRGHGDLGTPVAAVGSACFADYLGDVGDVLAACDAPPVLVGHDLGGLLALASASAARAVVALAPLVPRRLSAAGNPVFSPWRARVAMARSRPLPPPRGKIGVAYFGGDVPGNTTPDSSTVARQLVHDEIPVATVGDVPMLVLAGASDPFAPPNDVERLAAQVGASYRRIDGASHAMPWEAGWEQRVAEIHRWLIHTLGDGLLLMREEDEE